MQLDINEADRGRRNNNGNTRFGGDSRVRLWLFKFPPQEKKYKMTPGPEYMPGLKP